MKDKVVIITGATKGMGFAAAKKLLELGAKVGLIYRSDENRAKECKAELQTFVENSLYIKADISNPTDRHHILKQVLSKFGRIDVLVNNAGVPARQPFLKVTEDEFDSIIAVNLKGPIFLAQLVAEQMIHQGDGGSIINFSSISGHRSTGGISYDVAKAGILLATQSMANVLGPHRIRVNSISPGMYKTEMNREHWENNTKMYQDMAAVTALKRGAEATEIAGTIVYLASDQSSYVTGTDIIADGGFLSYCPGRGK